MGQILFLHKVTVLGHLLARGLLIIIIRIMIGIIILLIIIMLETSLPGAC